MPRRAIAVLLIATLPALALPSRAAAPVEHIATGAAATAPATAVRSSFDVVSVTQTSDITPAMNTAVVAAAQTVGAVVAESRGASVGMLSVTRDGFGVQIAPAGYAYPMSTTVLPLETVAAVMGRDVSAPLARGEIVIGRTSADLRGARAGDVVTLMAAGGETHAFTIGLVAEDGVVGGTEIVIAPAQADLLGVGTVTRLLVYGFADRASIESALAEQGVVSAASTGGQRVRVRRSWDPPDPDGTLGMMRTKQLLGEFAYRVLSDGVGVTLSSDWTSEYMPPTREWLYAYPGAPANIADTIRAQCHVTIKADLVAALGEVHAAGLDPAIDFVNANTYGGCYYPRFNRVTGSVGFLSRHSWGMALDTNTTTNAQGSTPQMNCDVVRIFRRHGFAWGGNFTSRDGMHFEWVGEPRDTWQYPSTYCPNTTAAVILAERETDVRDSDSRATLFADDGWSEGDL